MSQSGSATEAIDSMKVAVIGSRVFEGLYLTEDYLDGEIRKYPDLTIISGGASGVDSIAKQYAVKRGFNYHEINANWSTYGRAAGPIRNKIVVEMADIIYAFWDEKSKGTWSTIQLAKRLGKTCKIVTYAKNSLIERL